MKYLIYISFVFGVCFSNPLSISGIIFNDEGKPSRRAQIEIFDLNDELISVAKTNRKGRFEFIEIQPDFYFLHVNHPKDGSIIIKINPRAKRNRDLVLRLMLKKEKVTPLIYTYSNVKPIQKDPALRIKNLQSNIDEKSINLVWKSLNQAEKYKIFRDNDFLMETNESSFSDSSISPGKQYCYKILALGKYNISGVESDPVCNSSLTNAPINISGSVSKNTIILKWDKVSGAANYLIRRNGKVVGGSDVEVYEDDSLEYYTKYFYSITSTSINGVDGLTSLPFEITTRDYVEPPALSSFNDQESIKLIWNEVKLAKSYNLYRDGGLISSLVENSYEDKCYPGETHCYQITSVDKYNVESKLSGKHCSKLNLKSPTNLNVIGGIKSNLLSWNKVLGAFQYFIFNSLENDSIVYLEKTKDISFVHRSLDYDDEFCYTIIAVDSEGDKSGFSKVICGKTNKPPLLTIKNAALLDDSQDNILNARENGKLRLAILNEGGSPSKNIKVYIKNNFEEDIFLNYDTLKVIDIINVDEAKYVDFNFKADLKIKSGDWKFQIFSIDENDIQNKSPYEFLLSTKSVEQPNIILADYSIENNFGTNYIPKNEIVNLTLRVQNVGIGLTEKVDFILLENHTYTAEGFTGLIQIGELNPGDYKDIDLNVKSSKEQFAIKFKTNDYLDNEIVHQVDLELMKNYRSKLDLNLQEIGSVNIIPYPIEFGEVDVEKNIPIGKRNMNNMAVLLAIDEYDDIDFIESKYSGRDRDIFRLYMQNLFGMDDYQLYPSKLWQMEQGPIKNDFTKIFDPHQGIVRNRVIASSKYSNVDFVDISIFYSGLGSWFNDKPYLIPQDAKKIDPSSYVSLEEILMNLSKLSVLQNINSIMIYLDIKYINYFDARLDYKYPELSKKLSILSSSSPSETSQESDEMKHSIFSYFLLKGMKGEAIGDDKVLEVGELAEYLYRKIPEYTSKTDDVKLQNPEFIGSELKRVILDLK